MKFPCLIFIAIISFSTSYKYLVYNPFFGYSHLNLLGSLSDVLTEGGHEVTILMPEIEEDYLNQTGTELTKKIIRIPGDPRAVKMLKESKKTELRNVWSLSASPMIMWKMTKNLTNMLTYQCEYLMNDEHLLQSLREEKFDVGVAEAYYVCGLALFEALNINTTIAMLSNIHLDSVTYAIGEPSFPSYVPGLMSTTGDRMTFSQRLQNVLALIIGREISNYVNEKEIDVLRQKYGSFKDHYELIAQTSFIFTRSNPYLDFPRPTLHKTVMIGGFEISRKLHKDFPLNKELSSFLDKHNRTILISFGSVAKSADMPDNYKKNILAVFSSMSDVGFIWKYEDSKLDSSKPSNVLLSAWLPQVALLKDKRLSAFLTHGGIGSCNEVAYMGKPAIIIPLFGDQMRNAQMMARQGGALVLDKDDLSDADNLKNAFKAIINEPRYAKNALRLSQMLRNQPITPQELLLRHAEFAAKFGRFSNLDSYGRRLSTTQYYLLDIAAVAVIIMILIAVAITALVKRWCFSRHQKTKLD
ncbi:unnamed protein product [Cylicocyclus nassatus]|uniref:glucuronosyltransferase n=1 Tax=Cylicocyclus nassatus TaxID=53992 RepID=A0AA36LZ03_CYLNA|nr:unnamed protein product [Cylicocyclus nassatus]